MTQIRLIAQNQNKYIILFKVINKSSGSLSLGMKGTINNENIGDATEALIALGYSSSDVLKAIGKMDISEETTVQDIIKGALRVIGTF